MNAKLQKEKFLNILDSLIKEARKRFKEENIPYIEENLFKGRYSDIELQEEINDNTFYNDYVNFSPDCKVIKIKVSSCSYRILNTYRSLLVLRKKINAIITSSKPYDWHVNRPSLKPKGVSLDKLQAEAWFDFENIYLQYRRELNLEKCTELKNSIKDEMPELYDRIVKREKADCESCLDLYRWNLKWLNENTDALVQWEQTLNQVENRQITLKSLKHKVPRCSVPSYSDLTDYVKNLRDEVNRYKARAVEYLKEMELFYPDLLNEINQAQAA